MSTQEIICHELTKRGSVVLMDKAVFKKEMDNAHINKTCG